MKPAKIYALFAITGLMLIGCANQLQPAQSALDNAQSAVQAASADGSKYMPEHFKNLQARLATVKASFDNKDYAAVLASAPEITTEADKLSKDAAAKKREEMTALASQWGTMSASLPKLIDTVKVRIGELGKTKHPPKGVDVASAQADLTEATTLWTKAQASHSSGDEEAAVNAGKDVKAKTEAAADALKLKLAT